MSKSVFIISLAMALIVPPVLMVLASPAPAGGPRLVLHAPWVDGADIVRRAGGNPVGPEEAPMGIFAYAPDPDAFDRRALSVGAWAVLDGTFIAAICGFETSVSLKGTNT